MMNHFDVMNTWIKKRAEKVSQELKHLGRKGGFTPKVLDSPEYRLLLGQHQAYTHMLSFIHSERRRAATPDAVFSQGDK